MKNRLNFSKIKKVFIIAEIGKNFIQTEKGQSVGVYLANAKKLVDEAKRAGADAVKFQTHSDDEQLNIRFTSPHFKQADRYSWIQRNIKATPVDKFWKPLKDYCDKLGITFFSTPMSRGAARTLQDLGVGIWKVGSGDILDFVMLDYLAGTGKPVIISSGMSTLREIEMSVNFLKKRMSPEDIALLHCVSRYPCPVSSLRLGTIGFFKKRFGITIGFSDHSIESFEPVLASIALGAKIVEKHFTLNRNFWGSDHKSSLMPDEFSKMTKEIRKAENKKDKLAGFLASAKNSGFLGKEEKFMQPQEAKFRPIFRKTLVAAEDMKRGKTITADLIYAMRPQKFNGGLPSENYEKIIGKKLTRGVKKFQPFKF
ncbi:MAG: N-acetylneuraminate synthase family protein [bacterium]|nr:N-acetylneuraminate synthase family protein [bacterium]